MDEIECVVIGAGVVGLACARALAAAGREVVVLERERGFGSGISSRNSEVIHAGLYYPPGSLKARWCARGRELLYDFCASRGVAHRACGKLVVAPSEAQVAALEAIRARGEANGAPDLRLLDAAEARAREPALRVAAALWSPATGIVDSHGLMLALLGDAERDGAMLALESPVTAGTPEAGGMRLTVGGAVPSTLCARWVVNAAGLDAVALAAALGSPAATLPEAHFARGVYFTHSGRLPFSHLIYPVPEPGGLGVHLTLDLAGQGRFGPDVAWIPSPDYHVDPARAEHFAAGIRHWWPALDATRLQPGYAGVRPKLVGPGMPDADFRLDGPEDHGVPGLLQLLGIESPGLTAALAIGEAVAARVAGD